MKYRSYLVKGRVQGVGFRYFVRGAAAKLSLTGMVKNMPDGTVYAEAAGNDAQLHEFEGALRKGPALAKVTDLSIQDIAPFSKTEFSIER